MRAVLLTAAVAMAAMVGFASTASATAPAAITIAGTVTQFGPPPDFKGVWQSSGGISDAGSFVETEFHATGTDHTPVVGVFQAVIVFSGSQGTFTITQQAQFRDFPEGTWQVESGTGAYDRATGHGTFKFVPPNNLTFTGVISKAG
jgi:hypothetical protein